MPAILLKEHLYHHAILLPPIQAIFKHGLFKCAIYPEAVVKLMAAYPAIATIPGAQPNNVFVDIMMDKLKHNCCHGNQAQQGHALGAAASACAVGHKSQWSSVVNGHGDINTERHVAQTPSTTLYFNGKMLELLPFFVGFMKRTSTSQQLYKEIFQGVHLHCAIDCGHVSQGP